jgi:hypothetical protein
MNSKTNQKLWIFGDSFATIRNGEASWQILLKNKFVGSDMIVSARGGRDIQTIVDIFLKSLHLINDDDLVIMILPTSSRVRYPLKESVLNLESNGGMNIEHLKEYISDGFIAYHANSIYHKNLKSKLIFPFDVIDDMMLEDIDENLDNRERYYNLNEIKKILNKKQKLSYNQISTIINTSETVLKNYNNQFYSFSKAFKFKTIFFNWSDDFEIFDKSVVISDNQIGKLQTQHELYIESDNQFGEYGDHHWSNGGNIKFSEYIINNNPKYFN